MNVGSSQVSWAGRTYREIRSLGESAGSVLILPLGSVEQHGPHLPVATDTILATALAEESADSVNDDVPVLVAPPVWTGLSPHHLSFGGTLNAQFESLLHLLQDVIRSGCSNGFDAVFIVNGHGGNRPVMGAAISTAGSSHPEARVLGVSYFDLAAEIVPKIRDSDTGGMSHAGEFETSLLMHVAPQLVREDEVAATYREEPHENAKHDMFDRGVLTIYRSFDEYTDSGVVGDPTVASAAKGKALYEELVSEVGEILYAIHEATTAEQKPD